MKTSTDRDFPIVAMDKFVLATRDSGYRNTASAISELVDNALQAGSTEVVVTLTLDERDSMHPIVLRVLDNGSGMDARTLRTALRFGGSTRFNDRCGLGRYGMGLPNSSLSQAKKVVVHTWKGKTGRVLRSYLDIDEIASGDITEVPAPVRVSRPNFLTGQATGTAVTWTCCDRLDNRRITTMTRKLLNSLGRRFRYFLWNGVSIKVNGEPVEPIDPLFLDSRALFTGGKQFCEDLIYEVSASAENHERTGTVRIRFSELPVDDWSRLSNREKRTRGIVKGAGVSVVRAGREIDHGWFFFGGKRRENYDDWWRCEIRFDPVLDEAFGITHTKQQIRPSPHLIEALSPDMEAMARTLSNRARKAHKATRLAERFSASEARASEKDKMLAPLVWHPRPHDERVLAAVGSKCVPSFAPADSSAPSTIYKIVPAPLSETVFFNYARSEGRLLVVINPEHPFYKVMYRTLLDSDSPRDEAIRSQIDLLLFAAARSEASLEDQNATRMAEEFRKGWSDTLATFLNG